MSGMSTGSLVTAIHAAGRPLVLIVTGGGSLAISDLLTVPGASRTVLEALVPYSGESLTELLGKRPDQYCSEATARAMAVVAYQRAVRWRVAELSVAASPVVRASPVAGPVSPPLSDSLGARGQQELAGARIAIPAQNVPLAVPGPVPGAERGPAPGPVPGPADQIPVGDSRFGQQGVVGVGLTASLASASPKRGPHRIFLALHDHRQTEELSVILEKGVRDRAGEEAIAAHLILSRIAHACHVPQGAPPPGFPLPLELVSSRAVDACLEWRELISGQRATVATNQSATALAAPLPQVVFSGAFNPVHDGHLRIAEIASQLLAAPTHFELSIENVDKPPLDFLTIDDRRRQFADHQTLWLTRAPTFAAKSRIFPGATFVVGVDTIARIAQPKYYGGSDAACRQAVATIAQQGCRFLVFGRVMDGTFRTLDDLSLATDLRALCRGISASDFRSDLSSTELRREANQSTFAE